MKLILIFWMSAQIGVVSIDQIGMDRPNIIRKLQQTKGRKAKLQPGAAK